MADAFAVLDDVRTMYFAYLERHKKPPLSKADLAPYADKYPKGAAALDNPDWVVRWGTRPGVDVHENADTFLAYGLTVGEHRGAALAADGGVVELGDEHLLRSLDATPIAHQIARMYLRYFAEQKKLPPDLNALQPYSQDCPDGFQAVKDGAWVVNWGTEISPDPKKNGTRLLAYDRRAPLAHSGGPYWGVYADNSAGPVHSSDFKGKRDK